MMLRGYLKDSGFLIILNLIVYIIIGLMLFLLSIPTNIIIIVEVFLCVTGLISFFYYVGKRIKYYSEVESILEKLDKKFILPEIIKEPEFEEGKILYNILKITDKSMHEEINKYKYANEEHKEYMDMWVHEVKTPIASSKLIIENNKNDVTLNLLEELEKIEGFVEQVLYYSKISNVEKDYIVREFPIINSINNVIRKNKKYFREKRIALNVDENINDIVFTDTKWFEFILNQIIGNSIKYCKRNEGLIKIYSKEKENSITLFIEDNGVGIDCKDIDKVFEKGFTGKNGRNNEKSTGMGLYITKKLCDKLSLGINISSKINEGTVVSITFPKSKFILLE